MPFVTRSIVSGMWSSGPAAGINCLPVVNKRGKKIACVCAWLFPPTTVETHMCLTELELPNQHAQNFFTKNFKAIIVVCADPFPCVLPGCRVEFCQWCTLVRCSPFCLTFLFVPFAPRHHTSPSRRRADRCWPSAGLCGGQLAVPSHVLWIACGRLPLRVYRGLGQSVAPVMCLTPSSYLSPWMSEIAKEPCPSCGSVADWRAARGLALESNLVLADLYGGARGRWDVSDTGRRDGGEGSRRR